MNTSDQAAIITIGDEILIGQIIDTNSAWLGNKLNDIGIKVEKIISIQDREEEILDTLDMALNNYNITFVTGGLGPTKDDITKTTLSKLFNSKLIINEQTYTIVKEMLNRRGIEFNTLNQSQALVPECCEVIINNHGTAPGMLFTRDNRMLFSMPGVPHEMKQMCEDSIFPILKERLSLKSNIHRNITTFGLAESLLAEKISNWETNLPSQYRLAYLPSPNRIILRLSAYNITDKAATEKEIDNLFLELKSIIPENYIGEAIDNIESVLAKILIEKGATLSIAESCTGGIIASKFTKMAGASKYFIAGVVSYSNQAKIDLLGVKKESIDTYGAVSKEVVEEMALGIRKRTNSTYSLATSGIAGPDGGTTDKPVGTVWIALATPDGVYSHKHLFGSLREPNIERAASSAIFTLYKKAIRL